MENVGGRKERRECEELGNGRIIKTSHKGIDMRSDEIRSTELGDL